MVDKRYIPGVCNIGDTEVKARRRLAIFFSLLCISLWTFLLILNVPAYTYALLVMPAFIAATSYIQSREHFCAGFGAEGYYNFSNQLGRVQRSDNPEDHAKDRKKSLEITARALGIGVIVAAFAAGNAMLLNVR